MPTSSSSSSSSEAAAAAETPIWSLVDPGSFASIRVILPRVGSSIHCESDAVVTFSDGCAVRGSLQGGFFSSLARTILGGESFFFCVVENANNALRSSRSSSASATAAADVLMAPADPGGIVLHRLGGGGGGGGGGGEDRNDDDDDLILIKGSYVASDVTVKVSTQTQSKLSNSLLSGTGLFLLRVTGKGVVAFAGCGAIHKFVLRPGETRAVDNGHVVGWSASMVYRTGLAAGGGIFDSVSSGEGLMCFFSGPGTIYLQSHKPAQEADATRNRNNKNNNAHGRMTFCDFFVGFALVLIFAFVLVANYGEQIGFEGNNFKSSSAYRERRRPIHGTYEL